MSVLFKNLGSWLFVLVLLVLGCVALAFMIVVVDTGHVGVVRTFGAVQSRVLKEGLNLKRPFIDEVEQFPVQIEICNVNASAYSNDLQPVTTQVILHYSLNGALAPQICKNFGTPQKITASLIQPAIQESVKSVAAKFTAPELITKRDLLKNEIRAAMDEFLSQSLEEKELGNAVKISNLAVMEFNFSPDFMRAVESKMVAEQLALQLKNDKIMRAETGAEERRLAAEGEAAATEIQTKARAKAIGLMSLALTQNSEGFHLQGVEKGDVLFPRMAASVFAPYIKFDGSGLSKNATAKPSSTSR